MIEEDARVEPVVELDGKREAAFFYEDAFAIARRPPAGLLCAPVLRAATRAHARLHVHMLGGNVEYAGRDGEDVELARMRDFGVDGAGRRVFDDDEPASGCCRAAFIEIDGSGVIGQVGVVDAIAGDTFALRPAATQARDLDKAPCELLGGGDDERDGLPIAHVDGGGNSTSTGNVDLGMLCAGGAGSILLLSRARIV